MAPPPSVKMTSLPDRARVDTASRGRFTSATKSSSGRQSTDRGDSSSSASPPGSSSVGPATSPSRTVYREAGQNASLACGGVNANTLVRRLEWLCRGCRSSSPSHETTIAAFKGGRFVLF